MKIGVDASCWMNKRGYGRYTRELLHAMLTIDQKNEYWFFLDVGTDRQSEDLPRLDRAQRVIVKTSQAAAQAASASGHRSLRDLWAMRQAVRQYGRHLDLFYFPSDYTFFPVSISAKVVVTKHDMTDKHCPELLFPNWQSRLFWKLKVRLALWRANMIITVSDQSKRDIINEFGLKEETVRIVPDGVSAAFRTINDDTQTCQVTGKYGLLSTDRFILYVGGISPHKNLETLVDAYASMIRGRSVRDVKLVLIGDFQKDVFYSNYSSLQERVGKLGLNGKVIFTGFVSDEELVHFYNAAELLVLPSYNEGFGLPALEAMSCGLPVVASQAGALPEVVGDAGLFFNPHVPEELKDRLQELLDDKQFREKLGNRGLSRARKFSWENSARAALAAFDELVMR
jgi:glycosyltransferase involved in cell wall biosynthesis